MGADKPLGVVIEVLEAPAPKPYRVRMDGSTESTLYPRTNLVLPFQTPPAAGGGSASDPPPAAGSAAGGAPRISSSVLGSLGMGSKGVPGEHTREGMEASRDVPPPGAGNTSGGASGGSGAGPGKGNNATWRALGVPENMLTQPISLDELDPAAIANFRNAGGILPDLAGGAAGGNGRSAIIPVCKLLPGEVRLSKHFIEMLLGSQQTARFSVSGGLTISSHCCTDWLLVFATTCAVELHSPAPTSIALLLAGPSRTSSASPTLALRLVLRTCSLPQRALAVGC